MALDGNFLMYHMKVFWKEEIHSRFNLQDPFQN